jgi:hypothetical protein
LIRPTRNFEPLTKNESDIKSAKAEVVIVQCGGQTAINPPRRSHRRRKHTRTPVDGIDRAEDRSLLRALVT